MTTADSTLTADSQLTADGRGSQLAAMVGAAKKGNAYGEMWAVALNDNAAGVAASGTITSADLCGGHASLANER